MTKNAVVGVGLGLFAFSLLVGRWGECAEPSAAMLVPSATPGWPQWRGPRRDGVSEEQGLLESWPAGGPERVWSASGIGRGYSSPIIVGDAMYITGDEGDDLVISALGLDGSLRWQTRNGAAWERPYPGARSSCCYDGGKLYHMNAHGRLACLDASTGKELWAVDVLDRFEAENIIWGISESVLVDGDLVFVTPVGAKGLMAALDKQTGDTVWAAAPIAGDQASYASPILLDAGGRRLLVNASARHAFAVDAANGEVLWKIGNLDPGNTITTTPVLADGRIVITNVSRNFSAVYGIGLGGDAGERLWSKELAVSHGGIVGVDDLVYGASSRGLVAGWVSIDPADGSPALLDELPGGSLIAADGRFYCLEQRGMMKLQKAGREGFVTAGSFQLAEGKDVWAHPVVFGGRLYLRYSDTLYCYNVSR